MSEVYPQRVTIGNHMAENTCVVCRTDYRNADERIASRLLCSRDIDRRACRTR
jgi:hypothetical protein